MSGRREQNAASGDMTGMRRCAQTRAIRHSAALVRRLRAPVAGARARFAVAQVAHRRNPDLEAAGIWRMSD
jgi:hypothetical protein